LSACCDKASKIIGGHSSVRIGIDATAVPPKPMRAGWYIIYLIQELGKLETSFEFIIFAQEYLHPHLDGLSSDKIKIRLFKPMSRFRRLFWEQTTFPRIVREMKIDLLHSPHYTMPLSSPVPTVVTYHDMIFFIHPEKHTLAKRYFFPWMMRHSSKKAEKIITVSENTRDDAIRHLNIPPDKIVAIHLGYQDIFRQINDQALLDNVRQQYKLPDQFIFYAGAFEPRKNIPLLLSVYERLVQQQPDLFLVLTGGTGWDNEETLALMNSMHSKDQVIRLGHVPYTDLPSIYNLADVFVYPSLYEGFGLPPLEGMACGTPVITTNISSMPEVVGDAGLLVPPNDEAALLQAIQQVLDDPVLRQRLQIAGPKRAANFTWERTAQKTLTIYEEVLSSQ
jgi:glycosyltransferase involved in cell wall biosynthesis